MLPSSDQNIVSKHDFDIKEKPIDYLCCSSTDFKIILKTELMKIIKEIIAEELKNGLYQGLRIFLYEVNIDLAEEMNTHHLNYIFNRAINIYDGVRLVYHGAIEDKIDSINKNGFDLTKGRYRHRK